MRPTLPAPPLPVPAAPNQRRVAAAGRARAACAAGVTALMLVAAAAPAAQPPAAPTAPVPATTSPATTSAIDVPAATADLRLREVLARAVAGNPDLLRERAAIDLASANLLGAEGAFDFVLTADGTFARRKTPPINAMDLAAGTTTK